MVPGSLPFLHRHRLEQAKRLAADSAVKFCQLRQQQRTIRAHYKRISAQTLELSRRLGLKLWSELSQAYRGPYTCVGGGSGSRDNAPQVLGCLVVERGPQT